jgi:hypothetical protein
MTVAKRVLFLCLVGLLSGYVVAAPARVDDVRGEVEKRPVGALGWEKVTPGEKVEEGSSIRTGANSQADILTEQGHHFQVRSETTIEFTSLQADETKTHLEQGRVISKVHKLKDNERFSLQTPTAVCAVRGTEFDTVAGQGGTIVAVYHGVVGVAIPGSGTEVRVPAGQMLSVHNGSIEAPRPIPHERRASGESPLARAALHEVGLDMTRNQVIAAAAMEQRMAEYREGKSLIDVNGNRVRVDEYIVRPQPNQFKLVALDKRGTNQLDYFFYLGTFNQALPTDLSVALKDLSGTLGSAAPNYFLTAYEMGQSNTQDSIHDQATGGHLVQITLDNNGNYILTDPTNPSNTKTVPAAQLINGAYQVYNPLSDSFTTVSAAQLTASTKFGVYIPENDTFHDLAPGDTYWKTSFNTYTHQIDNITKISSVAAGATNVLVKSQDMATTTAGGFVETVVQVDPNKVDATITYYYGDQTQESYRTVLIDNNGSIAPLSAFDGISSGAQYKGELLKWNYEQQVSASEFQGRKIDLVVEPKIFIKSGLIN